MVDDERQEIVDASDLRKYRIELPNMADDELGPFEFRLYGHYKRVCGGKNDGVCWEAVRTTAEKTKMSIGQVVKSREVLARDGWIRTTANPRTRTKSIIVVDKWADNFERFAPEAPVVEMRRWKLSDLERAKQFGTNGDCCIYCGGQVISLDHWLPLSRGGDDATENLVPSCDTCNMAKANMTGEEFIEAMIARGWLEDDVHMVNRPSRHERSGSPGESQRSPGETKNKPYKNKPRQKKKDISSEFPGGRFLRGKYADDIQH